MGFFSQDCNHCGHPLLSPHAVEDKNGWMARGVAITPNGNIITGDYDGYGRLGEAEYAVGDRNTVYHFDCWDVERRPMTYRGESPSSSDQGWFFDDNVHNWASPAEAKEHENPDAPWRAALEEQVTAVCDNCGTPDPELESVAGRFCDQGCADAHELS